MADILQDIQYQGDNSTFIWKSPIEDFNTGSYLTVRESQEAIFFMNGQILDTFGAGRYQLETQTIPLLSKIFNKATNDKTPYHCEIYFVNKTEQMQILWGTDSKVQYTDPTTKSMFQIGARGEMSLRVEDARKLLIKLVGTEDYLGQAQLTAKFRAFLMVKVKPYLAKTMKNPEISIFDIDEQMDVISDSLHKQLTPDFAEYGLALERFFVTEFAKPVGDPTYDRYVSLRARQFADVAEAQLQQTLGVINQQTDAQRMIIEAQGLAQKRTIEGYTFQQEQAFEVSKLAAQNEGAGNFSSAGIGLGMMGGIAGGMGATIAGMTANAMAPASPQAPGSSQASAPQPMDEMALLKQKIEKLKMMKEAGMLSDEEFDIEKKKILSAL
ncbi:MAG TPA: SPFH domain-containing protein [Treponemataceae bacterium]|nr:SPFH domain-containing protein [Treponemataceae bacterium]HPS42905.1 SPFH domain-containing protein [Treponemataceae bacterium]